MCWPPVFLPSTATATSLVDVSASGPMHSGSVAAGCWQYELQQLAHKWKARLRGWEGTSASARASGCHQSKVTSSLVNFKSQFLLLLAADCAFCSHYEYKTPGSFV
eukprot:10133-Heterococcus_DN1.PRE.1